MRFVVLAFFASLGASCATPTTPVGTSTRSTPVATVLMGTTAPAPSALTADTASPIATQASRTDCDPAYPDVCIKPPPPDLDCKDVPHKRFKVLPPDPHKFDGNDKDGIGCES